MKTVPNNNIEVQIACAENDLTAHYLLPGEAMFRLWMESTLDRTDSTGSICLRVVDDEEMRSLNERYRGKDKVTNVLSFPADIEPLPGNPLLLGDIAICAPVVENEARQQNKPELNHWAHLTVHGVLHLVGYDHQSDAEARDMESLEVAILSDLDIPNPYRLLEACDD